MIGRRLYRLIGRAALLVFFLLASGVSAQESAGQQALLRVLQLANAGTAVSLTLQNGRTVLVNFMPGSVSDYMPYDVNRSTLVTFTVRPVGAAAFTREWAVPPLAPGHHTMALVGSSADNSLQLIVLDEDRLCEPWLDSGSCIILINGVQGSPAFTVSINNQPLVDGAGYRQAVVGGIEAGSYSSFSAVDPNHQLTEAFRLQRGFFEPNTIYLYNLMGSFVNGQLIDYQVGTVRRVEVDSMSFLRGLTADLQLTDGTRRLFATENIVALLQVAGFDQLLTSTQLPLTIFAPTDGAVLDVAPDLYQCIFTNPLAMRSLIFSHILLGSYSATQLLDAEQLPSMSGTVHTFTPAEGGFLIDGSVFVPSSLEYPTANGVVYLLDKVLLPDGFEAQNCSAG